MRRDAAVCPHCRTTSAAWVPCVGYRANDGTKDMGAATLVTPGPKGLAVDGTKLTDTGPLMIAAKCSLVSVLADTRPVDVLFVTAKGAVQSVFAGLAPGASASAPTRQNGGVIVGSAGWAQRENLSVGSTVVVCGPGELAPPLLLNQL